MAARPITIKDKNWYKEERPPGSPHDQLVIVRPDDLEILKGCPKVMTVQYVAELLAVSIASIYRWIAEYKASQGASGLCARPVGHRQLRIFRDDLAAYLATLRALQKG